MVNSVRDIGKQALEAAYDQYAATGSLSMRQIGTALNVSAPALYHHFTNKQALIDAVAERGFTLFKSRLRTIEATKPRKIIYEILSHYVDFAIEQPSLFGLMFVARRPGTHQFPRDFADHRSAVFDLLWKAVDQRVSKRKPDPDLSLHLAHDLWALTHGQILLWRAGQFEDDRTFREVLAKSIERFIDTI
ncbi:MAG: TetR/AcrR family transcriptional regulator [Gemmatimonadales bacterium]